MTGISHGKHFNHITHANFERLEAITLNNPTFRKLKVSNEPRIPTDRKAENLDTFELFGIDKDTSFRWLNKILPQFLVKYRTGTSREALCNDTIKALSYKPDNAGIQEIAMEGVKNIQDQLKACLVDDNGKPRTDGIHIRTLLIANRIAHELKLIMDMKEDEQIFQELNLFHEYINTLRHSEEFSFIGMGGVAAPPDTYQLALMDPLFKPNAVPSCAPVSDYNSSFSAICSAIQDTVVDIAFNKLRTDHQVSLLKATSSIQTTYNGIPSSTFSPGLLQITKCTDDLNNTLNSNPKASFENIDSALKKLSQMQIWLKNELSNLNSHIDAIAADQREGWSPIFTLDAADNSRISSTSTQTVATPEKKLPHEKFALRALAEVANRYQGFTNILVNEPIATPDAHKNLTHRFRSTTQKEIDTACLSSKAAITEHFKKCQLAISNAITSILADSLNIFISHLQQSGIKQMKLYASDINKTLNTMLQYLSPSQDETQEKLVESINHLKNAMNNLQDVFMGPVLREQYHALKNTVLNHLSAHAGPKLPPLEIIQHQLTQTSKSTEFQNHLVRAPQVLFA